MAKHIGYTQQAVTTAAAVDMSTFTAAQKADLAYIEITPESNGMRWRADGTDPTASVGRPVAASATAIYDDPGKVTAGSFKMVSQSGTSTVNIDFWSAP